MADPNQQQSEPTQPVFAPDGTLGNVPVSKFADTVATPGYEAAVMMTAPDGTPGYVPRSKVAETQKHGYVVGQLLTKTSGDKIASGANGQPQIQENANAPTFGPVKNAALNAAQAIAPSTGRGPIDQLEYEASSLFHHPGDTLAEAFREANPIRALMGSADTEAQRSAQAVKNKDYNAAAAHAVYSVIPFMGSSLGTSADQFKSGDISGGTGTMVGTGSQLLLGNEDVTHATASGVKAVTRGIMNPKRTLTEALPQAAGRAVGRMVGQPPVPEAAVSNVEKVPATYEGDVEPILSGGMNLFDIAPPDSMPYRVGSGVIEPEYIGEPESGETNPNVLAGNQGVRVQPQKQLTAVAESSRQPLALPAAAPEPIPLGASPLEAAPPTEGVLPAARRVTYDPQTGEARTQFLTSVDPSAVNNPAGALFSNEDDAHLLNDPRGALSRFVTEQDLGGLGEPFNATNPSPFSNPIRPKSTLEPWAKEVLDWERFDPQHLFQLEDEHDANMYRQQEDILRWIEAHNKQPESFQSSGVKTSQPIEQPGLISNAEKTNPSATPEVPTDDNTERLLLESIEQAKAKKNGPGIMGNASASAPEASSGPGIMGNAERRTAERIDPFSPSGIRISTLRGEMANTTDPVQRQAYQEAINREIALAKGENPPLIQQAEAENLPEKQPRTVEPSEQWPPKVAPGNGVGLSADKPTPASSLKPGDAGFVPIGDLNLDPKRFQYKTQGIGEGGVSNSLKGQSYNQRLAGVIAVWEDPANGKTYVVNGHHRFDLAKETGQPSMRVMKLDAPDAQTARAQGAIINIAEGRGTAYDAARFFQDSHTGPEQLQKEGVSLSEGKVSDGLALSKLDPSILDKVGSGQIPEQRAVAIGGATSDPAQQQAILQLIDKQEAKGRRVNNDTVSELARFVANSGNATIEQGGLFGPNQEIHSLALDKAELSAYIKGQISKEKRVFGSVADDKKAQALGQVENQSINPAENAKISQAAAQDLELYDKLSTTKGPINDILESAARDKANGNLRPEEARQRAYTQIREELRRINPGAADNSGTGSKTRPGFPAAPK